ncbi:FimB/Mfa2 family fimbrial subunit [Bacteroides sp. 51]|uniref:FimB/Mfa2 family fimbrial subunit n=1 Tax=Bacteroides sp. 51 TaxID=2302938 RepID=UPI0013D3F598|nr:FimB/Mfa2 family fimbrial subunit [Bacteroides sp. 51]NDV80606.1 hypothetical protein [Bacteroides sp. 51]
MKKYFIPLLALGAMFTVTSCIEESTDHCPKKANVLLDWVETLPITEDGNPVNVVIIPGDGSPEQKYDSDTHSPDIEIPVGDQTILVYEKNGEKHINNHQQTVSVEAGADGKVNDDPGFFSGGSVTVNVQPNSDLELPLYKQVRELIIELKLSGAGAEHIVGITGNFDGIATERHINNGFRPVDHTITRPPAIKKGNVDYTFDNIASESGAFFSGSRKLLGIDGEGKQTLTLTVTFKNGDTQVFPIDVTRLMDGFHTEDLDHEGSERPWYIKLGFDVDTSFEIVIVDWEDGGSSWIIPD